MGGYGLMMGFRGLALLAVASAPVASSGLSPAIRDFDGSAISPPPGKLSRTGLYQSIGTEARVLGDGIVPFRINSPLWSDGAIKERFISLPPGTKAVPTDTDDYAFPEGTVFIKNFRIDTVQGDSSSRILVETRFLVRHAGASAEDFPWHGITYRWARDQSDADLVSQEAGENGVVNIRMGGALRGQRWTWPNKDQCVTCHRNRGILGFITPQLNRPSGGDAAVNQLQDLKDRGVLASNPIAGRPGAFRWAGLGETGASLELRARSYFAANCSYCHGVGESPADHKFDYFHPDRSIDQGPEGLNGAYIGKTTHQGGDAFPQFIFKGYPESSYVLKRMIVRQDFGFTPTEQMPTLATFLPDSAGLGLLKDWICGLGSRPASACRLPEVQDDASYWDPPAALHGGAARSRFPRPMFREGILRVSPGALGPGAVPGLLDLRGRPYALIRSGQGEFRPAAPLRPGVYLVVTGTGTVAINLLKD
ncbi:MAG: glucose sorbosone dehydrogenase [Fibrobacteres bacterium]|nr:glucose sorbosone dehydrogenase [Fibrobacterota bacterium]